MHEPPKHNNQNSNRNIQSANIINNNDSSSSNRINIQNNKLFLQISNIINENMNVNNNEIIKSTGKYKQKRNRKTDKKGKSIKNKASKISLVPTQRNLDSIINSNQNNSIEKENNETSLIDLQLINININNRKYYERNGTDHILNEYTFNEHDILSICRIYYICLLSKKSIFYAFLFSSPIEVFPLRLLLLTFIFENDLALNALFYFDDKISEK